MCTSMNRVVLFLTVFSISITSYGVFCQHNFFHTFIQQCNNTFLIEKDTLYLEDVDKLESIMKDDRNGKCFVHCFLQKLDLVDPKGIIRKQGLFENIENVLQNFPNESKNYNFSSKLRKVTYDLIETCENSDLVKFEADPCEKLFKFFVCVKNTE